MTETEMYRPNETQIRNTVTYAKRVREPFPKKVIALLAIGVAVVAVGFVYAAKF